VESPSPFVFTAPLMRLVRKLSVSASPGLLKRDRLRDRFQQFSFAAASPASPPPTIAIFIPLLAIS